MFIYNLKLNSSILFKILLGFIIAIVISLCGIIAYKIYKASVKLNDDVLTTEFTELNSQNYASVLQSVHNNIDNYVGQKIKFSGFVYRVYDLNKEQFVLGRNMIISSDFQTVVVGFLCHYKDAITFKDSTWVEIEGRITKGTYQNKEMPILEILSIQETTKPSDEYVYPPDDNYIPTSLIIKILRLSRRIFIILIVILLFYIFYIYYSK